jgi:hypothetical protein
MNERNRNLDQTRPRYANYWQTVLRFGLPFVALYQGLDYVIFRIVLGDPMVRYPWPVKVAADVPFMFLVSTIWWLLMRQIATWKRKIQQR